MDLDDLLTRRRPGWQRLAALVGRARRSPAGLAPDEVDELVAEYLQTSTDLVQVRTRAAEPALTSELTSLVAGASSVVYGTGVRDRGTVRHAITVTFPAAVWHLRRAVVVAAALLVLPALLAGGWVATSADARAALGDPEDLRAYVEEDFTTYYTEQDNTVFAASVGTNNARVGATAFGLGILAGVPTAALLAYNGANVGVAGGLFHAFGNPATFWTSILPHGLLELTAIMVAGGAGLHLGWALLVPGERTRSRALSEEGQQAAVVALGLVPTFGVAALLEGYVTPRTWAWPVEVGLGALALGVFLLLVVGLGRGAPSPVDSSGTTRVRVAGTARDRVAGTARDRVAGTARDRVPGAAGQTRPRATSPR